MNNNRSENMEIVYSRTFDNVIMCDECENPLAFLVYEDGSVSIGCDFCQFIKHNVYQIKADMKKYQVENIYYECHDINYCKELTIYIKLIKKLTKKLTDFKITEYFILKKIKIVTSYRVKL